MSFYRMHIKQLNPQSPLLSQNALNRIIRVLLEKHSLPYSEREFILQRISLLSQHVCK